MLATRFTPVSLITLRIVVEAIKVIAIAIQMIADAIKAFTAA